MAEVVNSLFGITPESLQAQRDAALQTQALQYAQLDPFQRATASIYAGANKLGGAIGGMLGAQDPAMAQATQRQALLQQARPQDANGWRNLAKQLWEAKDVQGAQEALAKAQAFEAADLEKQKTLSVIAKNTAEQRAAATPADIQKAQTIAGLRQALRTLEAAEKTPETLAAIRVYKDQLEALLPADKTPSFGSEAERYARQFYGKPYSDLTQAEMAKVNAKVEETAKDRSLKVINQLPGVEKAGDITGLRKDIQAITKPYQDKADAANDAIDLADMAIKSNNFAAVSSLSRSLAKAAGDQQITGGDVAAFNVDPSLVGTVSDTLARLSKGRPTVDTLRQLRAVAVVIEAKSKARIQQEEEQTMAVARASGLFTEPQIQTVFPRRPKDNAPAKTAFTSVKEAEAAKLPKGTIITINGRRAVVE